MRAWTLLMLLLAAALAGCADEPAETTETADEPTEITAPVDTETSEASPSQETGSTEDSDETAATNETETPANLPPVANLTADLTEGEVPLPVTFTVTVSDEDGDLLWWSLDADGDGVEDFNGSESGDVEFTYETVGTFPANLTVSDGTDSAGASLTIVATEVPPVRETLTCDVMFGSGNPVISVSFGDGFGGCNFDSVSAPSNFVEADVPDGCSLAYDADGDGFSDGYPGDGRVLQPSDALFSTCDAGVFEVTVSMTVEHVE